MNWFKRLFKRCEHDYEFVRNIYGDEINFRNGNRSEWRCKKCGKIEYRRYLQEYSIMQKLDNLYNEYYANKYNSWKSLRSETLNKITEDMINAAKNGECWYDIILFCEEKFNDRNYYEKWFEENNLRIEVGLYNQKEVCDEVNKYKFHVRWSYKW